MAKLFEICGTPGFISPEMLAKKGYDFATDIFSLGRTLQELAGFLDYEVSKRKDVRGKIVTLLSKHLSGEMKPGVPKISKSFATYSCFTS